MEIHYTYDKSTYSERTLISDKVTLIINITKTLFINTINIFRSSLHLSRAHLAKMSLPCLPNYPDIPIGNAPLYGTPSILSTSISSLKILSFFKFCKFIFIKFSFFFLIKLIFFLFMRVAKILFFLFSKIKIILFFILKTIFLY